MYKLPVDNVYKNIRYTNRTFVFSDKYDNK